MNAKVPFPSVNGDQIMIKVFIIGFFLLICGAEEKLPKGSKVIPAAEPEARKIMAEFGLEGGKFIFLQPLPESSSVSAEFSVLFLNEITWNGQQMPSNMNFYFSRDPGPTSFVVPLAVLQKYNSPGIFTYSGAKCRSLTLAKTHTVCALSDNFKVSGGDLPTGAQIAFAKVPAFKSPKVEYAWLATGPAKLFGKKFDEGSIIKLKNNEAKLINDEVTSALGFGQKND